MAQADGDRMVGRFLAAVKRGLAADTHEWGLADRYEARGGHGDTHEQIINQSLLDAGFVRHGRMRYPNVTSHSARPDGVVGHHSNPDETLWYEVKSVYLPHYWNRSDRHNHDYERFLRMEHPNGALGDVERLRGVEGVRRVFLLLALSWSTVGPAQLKAYSRHRNVLIEAFALLAGLDAPSLDFTIRGRERLWSCRTLAWVL